MAAESSMARRNAEIWLPSQSSLNKALSDHQQFSSMGQQFGSSNQSFNSRYDSINPPLPPVPLSTLALSKNGGRYGPASSGYGYGWPQLTEPAQQQQANGFMQQQNYLVPFLGNGFAGLLGKCSPGTGVFLPNTPNLSNKITTKNKTGTRKPKQQQAKESPRRNLSRGRGNHVWTKQKQKEEYRRHHVYVPVAPDSALPEEWSY